MASYQPIQMPGFQGFGIAEAVRDARDRQRQERMDAFNQMIQQGEANRSQQNIDIRKQEHADALYRQSIQDKREEQDRQAKIHQQITELHNKRLSHEAQQLAGVYGLQSLQQPNQMQKPEEPQQPQAPEFVGPIDTPEHARALAQDEAGSQLSPQDGPVVPRVQEAGDLAAQQVQQQQAERDRFAQQQAAFPGQQQAYQHDLSAYQQAEANPTYHYSGPNGLSFDVNPMEHEQALQAQNARRADEFRRLAKMVPGMEQFVPEFAARVQLNEDPRALWSDLTGRQKAEAAARAKDLHDQTYSPTVEQQDEWHRLSAAAAMAHTHMKENIGDESAAARAQAQLERAMAQAEKAVNWKDLGQSEQIVRSLRANLGPGTNPLQHKDAMIQLARYFRQAQPTEGEMHTLYQQLGGTVDKMDQFIARVQNGDISPKQLQYVVESANIVANEHEERKARAFKSLRRKFGPGSGMEYLAPQINNNLKSLGDAVGLEVPDVYEVQPGDTGAQLLAGPKGKKGKKPAQAAHPPEGTIIRLKNGKTVRSLGDGTYEAVGG